MLLAEQQKGRMMRVSASERILDLIGDQIGLKQREEYRCAQLLYFLNRLEGMYKVSTGRNSSVLQ